MNASRLVALDGLRGIAAIIVVFWHFASLIDRPIGTAMLAVDLFFIISGFVIPYAYERKLNDGLSLKRFFIIRMVRLYPLYALGVLISLVPYLLIAVTDQSVAPLKAPLKWLFWAIPLLPYPALGPEHSFLLNPPAWSLFFEVAINIAYVAALPKLNIRTLYVIFCVATMILLVAAIRFRSLNFGTGGLEMLWGTARITSPFTLGVILYRRWPGGWGERFSAWAFVPPILFLVTLFSPSDTVISALISLALVLGLFPLLLMIAVSAKPHGFQSRILHGLGEMSYPLYVLHLPILIFFRQIALLTGASVTAATVLGLPAAFIVSTGAIFLYDRPLRSRLEHALGLRRRDVNSAPAL